MVDLHLGENLDDPPESLGQHFLAQQLAGKSVSLENLLVVDSERDETDVRDFLEDDGIEDDVEEVEVRSEDLASAGSGALDEELDGASLAQEQLEVLVEDDAVEGGVPVVALLEEEGAAALDDEREHVGLQDGLVSYEVGQPQPVDEEDVADQQEVDVGPVGRQQHDRHLAVLLDRPDLLQHLHVETDLLVEALEELVQRVGHAPHHRHLHLCDQVLDDLLSLSLHLCPCLLGAHSLFLHELFCLVVDGLENSA